MLRTKWEPVSLIIYQLPLALCVNVKWRKVCLTLLGLITFGHKHYKFVCNSQQYYCFAEKVDHIKIFAIDGYYCCN
uniref:Putative secreted protein n=1 Tax=Panstrongylus lignarius TaxID=156445 RepID=A0A224XTH4_9HEMI